MKTLLFPYSFKMWGWCVLTIGVAFGIYAMVADYGSSLVNNIAIIGTVIGAMFVTCSREKIEDEMVLSYV